MIALQCVLLINCGGEPRLVPPVNPSPVSTTEASVVPLATPTGAVTMPPVGQIVWAATLDPASSAPTEPVLSYVP
ncbi:MAG TPA: hypothetical protein VK356_14255, partial [Thermomicrobiales bacterium]|nr:hypothetical protein [Thermomicrobiales bacterium]